MENILLSHDFIRIIKKRCNIHVTWIERTSEFSIMRITLTRFKELTLSLNQLLTDILFIHKLQPSLVGSFVFFKQPFPFHLNTLFVLNLGIVTIHAWNERCRVSICFLTKISAYIFNNRHLAIIWCFIMWAVWNWIWICGFYAKRIIKVFWGLIFINWLRLSNSLIPLGRMVIAYIVRRDVTSCLIRSWRWIFFHCSNFLVTATIVISQVVLIYRYNSVMDLCSTIYVLVNFIFYQDSCWILLWELSFILFAYPLASWRVCLL